MNYYQVNCGLRDGAVAPVVSAVFIIGAASETEAEDTADGLLAALGASAGVSVDSVYEVNFRG